MMHCINDALQHTAGRTGCQANSAWSGAAGRRLLAAGFGPCFLGLAFLAVTTACQRTEDLILSGFPAVIVLVGNVRDDADRIDPHDTLDAITNMLLLVHEQFEALFEIAAHEALHRFAV